MQKRVTIESLPAFLDEKLEDEPAVLAVLLAALGKGQPHPDLWERLHEAADRDDRSAELAFAYEKALQPRNLKGFTPPLQIEALMHAAAFSGAILADLDGAIGYLERVLAMSPGHQEAFERLEHALVEKADGARLCEMYVQAAQHQATREDQLRYLRRAAELVDVFADEAHRAFPIYERILKIEPGDGDARRALETWYRRAKRWAELAKLLEPLAAGEGAEALEARSKLLSLYGGELRQPDRAIVHIEELLRVDPANAAAREAARPLLEHKMLAARAAAALEQAYGQTGELREAAQAVGVLVEAVRGQAKTDAQKRLGRLLLALGDEAEAFSALEKVVAQESSDDETRAVFRTTGVALGRQQDVAKLLLRVATAARDPALRARLNLEAGDVLLEVGERKRARAAFSAVLEAGAGDSFTLTAARALEILLADEPRALAEVLERLVAGETDEAARARAAARLGEVYQRDLGDVPRAITAWQVALTGPRSAEASAALEVLHEQAGDLPALVSLLEARAAKIEGDEARRALVKAATVRGERLGDTAAAIVSWQSIARRFGPSREGNERLFALHDARREVEEAAAILVADAGLVEGPERGAVLARLASFLLERKADVAAALGALNDALAADGSGAAARGLAERLLAAGPSRIEAATALEAGFRARGDAVGLLWVLEAQGAAASGVKARLAALDEAVRVASADQPSRALELSVNGLSLAIEQELSAVPDWLVQVELLAGAAGGAGAHAALLERALGDRPLAPGALVEVARRAADGFLEAQEPSRALPLLRRVLASDPANREVRGAIDRALSRSGAAGERVDLWREALARDPGDDEALGHLEVLFLASQSWDELLKTQQARLDRAEGPAAASILLRMEAPSVRAGSAAAFLAAIDGARGASSWEPEQRRGIQEARARALAGDPGRREEALVAYRALIEASPRDGSLIEAFERLLAAEPAGEARVADRRWLLSWKAESAAEPAAALLDWAAAEETDLGDRARAVELYRRVLVLDPTSERASTRLVALLLEAGDAEGARGALLARRVRSDAGARRGIDLALGALLCDRLGRLDDAISALLPVLDVAPGDPEALAVIDRVLRAAGAGTSALRRAAGLLEGAAAGEGGQRWLEVLLDRAPVADLEGRRRGWFERLIATCQGDDEAALRAALRAVEAFPTDQPFWDEAERLARSIGRPDEVVATYQRLLPDPTIASAIGQRAVDFQEEWVDDPDAVLGLVERVLAADPTATWAFDRLKISHGAAERWTELLSVYDRMIAAVRTDEERLFYLADAAEVAKDFAADDGRAIGYLEQQLALSPDDARLEASLERLYERAGRPQSLVALLERQINPHHLASAQPLRARIAALWLDEVGDVESSFRVIDQMLAAEPEHPEALALLERVLRTYERPAAGQGTRAMGAYQRAAARLRARYQEAGRHADLARILEIEIEGAASEEERARGLRELIDLRLGAIGDRSGAFEDAASLLRIEPAAADALAVLGDIGAEPGREARLLAVLTGVAEVYPKTYEGAVLWREAARVGKSRGATSLQATAGLYRRAIEEAPPGEASRRLGLGAAIELIELLSGPGHETERYVALGLRAELEGVGEARTAALSEMARLARGPLADPTREASAWRARLADDPDDREALDGLIESLERLGAWAELVEVLRRRSTTGSTDEQRRDLVQIARLFGEKLGEPAHAVEAWAVVQARFGEVEGSLEAMASLLEASRRHTELAALLEERAPSVEPAERRANLLRWLGDTLRGPLGEGARAVEVYGRALAADPANHAARQGLEALVTTTGHEAASIEALLTHLALVDDWRGVVALLEPRLGVAESDEEQARVLRETARLVERRGGEVAVALGLSCRALGVAPEDDTLAEETQRLALAARLPEQAIEAFRGAAIKARPAAARRLWVRAARLLQERGDAGADQAYERALALGGEEEALLAALVAIRRPAGGERLYQALLRLASARGGDLACLHEAGAVALALGDGARARKLGSEILAATQAPGVTELLSDPQGPASAAAQWAIEALTGEGSAQLPAAERVEALRRAAALGLSGDFLRRAAVLADRELNDVEGALSLYRQILADAPGDGESLAALVVLYRRLGRRSDLIATLRLQVDAQTDAAARAAIRLDLGLLLRDTGEVEDASEVLRAALQDAPGLTAARDALEQIYEALGQHASLVGLVEEQAEQLGGLASAEQWARAASLAEGRLGDLDRAASAHRKAADLGREPSLEALARIQMLRGDADGAVRALEQLVGHASPESLVGLTLRLVDAYLLAGRRDEARERLEDLASKVEDPDPIRARLVEVLRESGDWARLADLMALEATQARDPRIRATRLREAAELLLSRQNDPDRALPMLLQASELAPDDVPIRLVYCETLRLAGRLDEAKSALKSLVESYGTRRPKERALAHYQLGLALRSAGDRPAALAELDMASRIDPAQARVLAALGAVALDAGELDRAQKAFRALLLLLPRAPRVEAPGSPRPPVVGAGLGEGRVSALPPDAPISIRPSSLSFDGQSAPLRASALSFDGPPASVRPSVPPGMLRGAPSGEIAQPRGDAPPVSRVEALLSLADIAARQGDAARSAEFIDTAFSHANDAPGEQTLLEQGLRRRSNHELLARTLEGRLQLALSGAAIPLLAELADLYQHHLGRPADALEARLRTTRLAPASVELREAALGLARELGQIRVFAESLARLAASDLLPGETRFELWLAVARLREADLGDLRLAVVAYEEAEMLAPPAPDPAPALRRVWAQLQSVFERLGDLPALAALLERRASFESDSDSNPVLQARPVYALAELLLASPATVEQGVDKLELAMLLDPQVERVSGLFERVVAQQPDSERLLRAHVRFCREQNLLPQLIKALVQLGELPDGGTPPLREAATLSISSGDDRGADAILRQITELDQLPGALPDVIWALLTLADRLEGSGDPALSASLRERAAELSEPAERRGLLLEVVRLCRGPLHDLPRAARTLAVLHDAEPGDPALWQPLADLYRQIGDEVRLATLIEALLPIVDEKLRQTLRRELAGLWLRERPGQNTSLLHQAVRVLQDILLDDPADAEASTQLASLLERLGDRDLLARHLEQQIESAKDRSDGALLAALSLRLGALREQQNQPRAAVDAYRSGLDWAPESRDLLRAILRLVDRDGDAFEATELMEKLLPLESGPEASALALRLAALHDESWNHELAEKAIEAGYRIFPSTELRDQLITRYTEASRWAELAALLERDSASRATTPERASALRRAAEIQQKQLSNPVEAARLYELALALTPADRPVLLALLGVLAARPAGASSRRAVEALGHALEKTPHDPELLRLRAEQLFALGEHDAALADLDLALAHRGDLPAATALLEQALTRAAGQAQRTLRLRLAMLLLRAAQFDAARGHLDALLRLEPAHPEGLRALAALERAAGRPEAVIIPLRSLVTTIDGQALIPVALDLADLCEAARKPHDARAALERALRIAPDNVDLSRRLRRLYEQIGARRELAALLREDAARATESGPRFEALLGAARLLLDPQQGDLKLAAQLLDEARTLRPDDIDLALTLADAQVALKRPREAIALLSQLVNAHRGRRSRHLAQAYQKRAQLELASGDHVAGLASLSKAFESDGSNGLLAMEMGRLALELNDEQAASRAFRAITLMKVAPTATEEGTTIAAKAQAYYQLSLLALGQNDRRKARLLAEKAVSEDPSLEPARQLRDELKNG